MMIKTYLSLGSNLDDPSKQIEWAIEQLKNLPDSKLTQVSSLIRTKPVGVLDQPDFINAVVELQTRLSPDALLMHLLDLENQRKRERTLRWGPRTLDLDILLYGNLVLNEPDLIIPHPRMWEREFVLIPLYEIAPSLRTLCLNNLRRL